MVVKTKKKEADRHVEAVKAACEILHSFLHCPNQTLKQISKQTNMFPSRIMRLTGTLEACGFLNRDDKTRNYCLGAMLMSLGRVYEGQSHVSILGQSILKELSHMTGESASIYVLDNLERMTLAKAEGKNDIRMAMAVGNRAPVHLGAGGKVLLAFGPEEVREKILNSKALRTVAPQGIPQPARLAKDLDRIKTQGYALSLEERILDAGAIAAPIFELENRFLGALGIAGPINHFKDASVPEKIKLVMSAAAELSCKLGAFPFLSKDRNVTLESYLERHAFKPVAIYKKARIGVRNRKKGQ